MLYGRKGTPDEVDAGTETPINLADAKEEGGEVVRSQSTSDFLSFFKDFEKKQALGTEGAVVVCETVEPMLPTVAEATSQFTSGKVAYEGVKHNPASYVGIWMDLLLIPPRKPTMEEIRGMRKYGPREQSAAAQGGCMP